MRGCSSLAAQRCEVGERRATMVALTVFGSPASAEVARTVACLFEKNLEFELVRVDTFKGAHKVPEFIQLQDPTGQVTFKHLDLTFVESRKAMRHICTAFPEEGNKTLYGAGALERAAVEQWMQAEALSFEPASSDLVFYLAFAPLIQVPSNEPVIVESERNLGRILDVYDRRLDDSEFLAGEFFSLADLAHLPNLHHLVKTARGGELFAKRKNVARWWGAISDRQSWKEALKLQCEDPGSAAAGAPAPATVEPKHDFTPAVEGNNLFCSY